MCTQDVLYSNFTLAAVDIDTPTCSDCESETCPNPILPDILWQKKLTSGYMGIFSNAKPKGTQTNEGHSHNHKDTKELHKTIKEKNEDKSTRVTHSWKLTRQELLLISFIS